MSRMLHLARLRSHLEHAHWPRLQMMVIVALTGGIGFLASYLLLDAGMTAMWQRYPAAVGIAYLVFMALLWLWAVTFQSRAYEYLDVSPGNGGSSGSFGGGGGQSGGGGASASFDSPASSMQTSLAEQPLPKLDLPGADGCAGDDGLGWLLLAAIAALAALAALLLLTTWVVWIAPSLMAEVLLDVALAGGLYRRLRRIRSEYWLRTVLRQTFLPTLTIALLLAGMGYAGARYAPGADSIGDVVAAYQTRGESE
ncbi:hypothetical protein [Lysobacter silvisoli]|uniref:Transmembrane protein n=1 Tax=Lysobacter silvisoli TaxID=2293254 RepID=A0A371K373_9GAMM|nr:hypothetical protein [Lysobacter silvisoli]RDZ28379.1 hypothetical protein DX914_04370 [Lysobacter silvisoli]